MIGGYRAASRIGDPAAGHSQRDNENAEEWTMSALVIALLVLALIFGGIGLFLAAAKWALIIAVVLVIAGVVTGALGRGRSRL